MIVKQFIFIIINNAAAADDDDNNTKEDTNNWLNELDRETNQKNRVFKNRFYHHDS